MKKFIEGVASRDFCASLDAIKDYLSGVLGNFVIIRFVTREICCFGYRKTSFEERIEQFQFRQRGRSRKIDILRDGALVLLYGKKYWSIFDKWNHASQWFIASLGNDIIFNTIVSIDESRPSIDLPPPTLRCVISNTSFSKIRLFDAASKNEETRES